MNGAAETRIERVFPASFGLVAERALGLAGKLEHFFHVRRIVLGSERGGRDDERGTESHDERAAMESGGTSVRDRHGLGTGSTASRCVRCRCRVIGKHCRCESRGGAPKTTRKIGRASGRERG